VVAEDARTEFEPEGWRLFLAFLIAPLVGAAAASAKADSWQTFRELFSLFAIVGAYPATILFGLPAYFILKRRVRPSLIATGLVGGVIAMAPWSIITLLAALRSPFSSILLLQLVFIAKCFCVGFAGGAVFYFIAAWQPGRMPEVCMSCRGGGPASQS
jgi:hypothetical protein